MRPISIDVEGPLVRAVDIAYESADALVLVLDVVGRVEISAVRGPDSILRVAGGSSTTVRIGGREGWEAAVDEERPGDVVVTLWRETDYRCVWGES